MKKSRILAVLLFFGTGFTSVLAEPEAAQNIGVGFLVGYPANGISVKLPMSPSTSLNGLMGYDLQHSDVDLRFDYVWYQYGLLAVPKGSLPLYYGPGVHASLGSRNEIGVQGVVGVEYQFPTTPLDFFLELAPGINVLPATTPAISVGFGARFFF